MGSKRGRKRRPFFFQLIFGLYCPLRSTHHDVFGPGLEQVAFVVAAAAARISFLHCNIIT